jgi:hypothetical protein
VIQGDKVVASQFELFGKIPPADARDMFMVAGPSRTADIEKVLVLGAHGPRRLVVIFIGVVPTKQGQVLCGVDITYMIFIFSFCLVIHWACLARIQCWVDLCVEYIFAPRLSCCSESVDLLGNVWLTRSHNLIMANWDYLERYRSKTGCKHLNLHFNFRE